MNSDERLVQLESQVRFLTDRVQRLEAWVYPAQPAAPAQPAEPAGPPPVWASEPPEQPARSRPAITVTPSRVLAVAGGLVLLLGLGYLLRYAAAQGWLGPEVRVGLGLIGSAVLAVVGIRLERAAATRVVGQICTATASAGAYAAVVSAVVVYQLVPTTIGLVVATAVAGAAIARGVWSRSPWITALGVGGALVSPVLVSAADGAATLALLLVALTAGLGVAVRHGWPAITAMAFVVVAPQVWEIATERAPVGVALAFAAVCGVLVLLACVAHARDKAWDAAILPVTVSACNAVATAALGYAVLSERLPAPADWPGVWLLGVAIAHAAAGLLLSLRFESPPAGSVLTVAGLLLGDAAVLDLASGYAVAVLFGLLSLSAAAALSSRRLRDAAVPVVVVELAVFAVHALAFLVPEPPQGSAEAVLVVTALCAAAVAFVAVIPERERGLRIAGAVTFLALAVLRFLSVEAPLSSLLNGAPDVSIALVLCIPLVAAAVLLGQLVHRGFTIAGVALVNYGLSLAVVALDPDGAGRVALTGLWAGGGALALLAGRRRGLPDVRRGGAALLAAAVTKAALVDTTTLDGTPRATALLLCGAILVATAVAEARAAGVGDAMSTRTP